MPKIGKILLPELPPPRHAEAGAVGVPAVIVGRNTGEGIYVDFHSHDGLRLNIVRAVALKQSEGGHSIVYSNRPWGPEGHIALGVDDQGQIAYRGVRDAQGRMPLDVREEGEYIRVLYQGDKDASGKILFTWHEGLHKPVYIGDVIKTTSGSGSTRSVYNDNECRFL